MVGDVANGGDMAVTTAAEGTWHMTTALPSSSSVVVLVLVLVGDEGMDVPASMSPSLLSSSRRFTASTSLWLLWLLIEVSLLWLMIEERGSDDEDVGAMK